MRPSIFQKEVICLKIKLRVEHEQPFNGDNDQIASRISEIEEICCEELAKICASVPEYDYGVYVGVTGSPEMVENMAMHDAYSARFMTIDYGKNPTRTDRITGCLVDSDSHAAFSKTVLVDVYGLCIEVAIQRHGSSSPSPIATGEMMSYLGRLKNALKNRLFGT